MKRKEVRQAEAFNLGLKLFQQGKHGEALYEFRKAVACDDILKMRESEPLYLSYYGLTLALVKRKIDVGIKLCRFALSKKDNRPELFLNLGRIFELNNQRERALNIYRSGIRRHPHSDELLRRLQKLNPRGKAIFPFLNRNHILNKYTGIFVRRGLKSLYIKQKIIV